MSKIMKIIGTMLVLTAIVVGGIGVALDLWWAQKDREAKIESENALIKIEKIIDKNRFEYEIEIENTEPSQTADQLESDSISSFSAAEGKDSLAAELSKPISSEALYDLIPQDPVLSEINGDNYLGVLEIPALGIKLPVIQTIGWEPEKMDIAPCVYSGTFKMHNIVIMAHNYQNHFRPILNMFPKQIVIFTTIDGAEYTYTTISVDVFGRSEKSRLYDNVNDWDLTLFTCVPETYNRCAVRCKLINITNL